MGGGVHADHPQSKECGSQANKMFPWATQWILWCIPDLSTAADMSPGLRDLKCHLALGFRRASHLHLCSYRLGSPESPCSICSLGMGQSWHIRVCIGDWAQKAALTHGQQPAGQGQGQRQPPILLSVLVLLTRLMAGCPATLRGNAYLVCSLQHEWQFRITHTPFPAQCGLQS